MLRTCFILLLLVCPVRGQQTRRLSDADYFRWVFWSISCSDEVNGLGNSLGQGQRFERAYATQFGLNASEVAVLDGLAKHSENVC